MLPSLAVIKLDDIGQLHSINPCSNTIGASPIVIDEVIPQEGDTGPGGCAIRNIRAKVIPLIAPAAASFTNVPRSLATALNPLLAGALLAYSPFGWPLVIGGGLKDLYDLILLSMFRTVRPSEERDERG